ncbi:MAG: hypothetical protein JXB17_05035 [Bacteroidales bacterium]|nr:hypothetical protein [Bacteroidales bacterium]
MVEKANREKENKVLYYCRSLNSYEEKAGCDSNSPIQIKVIDTDNRDVILEQLGFKEENENIRFVVHIMLRK